MRALLGLLATFLLIANAAHYINIGLIERLELLSYDARVNFTMPRIKDQRIVIVDLDEKSLAEVGRWPWGRDKMARLVDALFDHYQIAAMGFDVLFAEPDVSSGLDRLQALERGPLKDIPQFKTELSKLAPSLDNDGLFAKAIEKRPVVLSVNFDFEKPRTGGVKSAGVLPEAILPGDAYTDRPFSSMIGYSYTGNLPQLQKAAAAGGHFNAQPDVDGVIRRAPMLIKHGNDYYESLSLAMFRLLNGSPPLITMQPERDLESLRIARTKIDVGSDVTVMVPFQGPQRSFPYVSASDVLKQRLPVEALQGAVVLVGTTAAGLFDLRATPVGTVYPGVEIHANLIAGMLDNSFKQLPPYALAYEVLILFLVGILLSFLLPRLDPLMGSLAVFVSFGLILGLNLYGWSQSIVLPLASPLLLTVAIFGINMTYGFFVERRAKKQITGLFGQYVPPELVDEMSEDPTSISMDSESRELTVLFSDVRSFTTISEGLDPKALSDLMNEYLTPMTHIIHKHRGTIDKYMGDAIMAFWGAPLEDKNHADHALAAGMEMLQELRKLWPQFKAKGWPELRIGVGLNSGSMSVGNMGSEFRRAYTVMGDAVNLGSRLEGLTKAYGVEIMVGESTEQLCKNTLFRQLDRVRVKGKDEPVSIYEPMGMMDQVSQEVKNEVAEFHEVLSHYFSQEWDQALAKVNALLEKHPDTKLFKVYKARIEEFKVNSPGTEWDGVCNFETK